MDVNFTMPSSLNLFLYFSLSGFSTISKLPRYPFHLSLSLSFSVFSTAIGEEFTFEDVNVFSSIENEETFADARSSHYRAGSTYSGSGSVGGIGLTRSISGQSDKSPQAPVSPGSSVGGSSVGSRHSDGGRSEKSMRSFRSQDTKDLKEVPQPKQSHYHERLPSC